MNDKRLPAVAGMFYSEDNAELRLHIQTLFGEVADTSETTARVFVAPHAGYMYSGLTAAHLFAKLRKNQFRTAIVISPSHQEYFQGISIFPGSAYITPFGEVPVNKQKADIMTKGSTLLHYSERGHRGEHAVEVQLPFLQHVLGDFDFIPVVMGFQDNEAIAALADRLQLVLDDETAIVVSSDLSHFHKKSAANVIDTRLTGHITAFNHHALYTDLQSGICEACGGGGIVAAMRVVENCSTPQPVILHRSDSGDTSGDNSRVVGYLSATLN